MVELGSEVVTVELMSEVDKLNDYSLKKLGVDRGHTVIPQALQFAAEMLDYHSREGNEKTMLLLSDGADWREERDDASLGEVVYTMDDPATLADDLHYVSQIRIHTIAISDEQALAKYQPEYRGRVELTPNPRLLELIAQNSHGHFFKSPDATSLAKLFDELGEGMLYPLQ